MKSKGRCFLIAVCFLAVLGTLSSCAFKEYDPQHPHEYSNYWNDEDNRKNSAAYPFTRGDERERNGPYGQ